MSIFFKLPILATKKSQKHHNRWKKQNTKHSCCMGPFIWNFQERQHYRDRKQLGDHLGLGASTECKWAWGNFPEWWNVLQLDHGYVTLYILQLVNFTCELYFSKNHSLDGIANMFAFSPYIASSTTTAGNQWLHFLTGRMLIAVMKHVKIILLNYSKAYVFASPTDWWNWVTLTHLASESKRCQDSIVCYSYWGRG